MLPWYLLHLKWKILVENRSDLLRKRTQTQNISMWHLPLLSDSLVSCDWFTVVVSQLWAWHGSLVTWLKKSSPVAHGAAAAQPPHHPSCTSACSYLTSLYFSLCVGNHYFSWLPTLGRLPWPWCSKLHSSYTLCWRRPPSPVVSCAPSVLSCSMLLCFLTHLQHVCLHWLRIRDFIYSSPC